MKNLILSFSAIFILSGCTTIMDFVEDMTEKSCSKQIELVAKAIETTGDTTMELYTGEAIDHDKKNKVVDKLIDLTGDLKDASAKCGSEIMVSCENGDETCVKTAEEKGKEEALSILSEVEGLLE